MTQRPILLMLLGFLLLMLGWVLPFLMVLHVLPSTFFLNFFAYTLSVVGLVVGIIGAAFYARLRK